MRAALLFFGLLLVCTVSAAWAVTVPEIVRMLDAGIGEAVILDQVKAEGSSLHLTSEEILALKDAGASDDFLRALIRTGSGDAARPNVAASQGEVSDNWQDRYASPIVRAEIYYDPFGYYWYAWPTAYAYYDPFGWLDCGFYYAGWWDHRWWRHGPFRDHHRWLYCYWDRPHGHSAGPARDGGRHVWSRSSRGDRRGDERGPAWGTTRTRERRPSPAHIGGRGGSHGRTVEPPGRGNRSDPTPRNHAAPRDRGGNGRAPNRHSGWKR